jgi:uncharacterized damage-inducible protein DinB
VDTVYIRTLFEYDRWANARVLEAVSKVSAEQFVRDLGSSYRSIRDTLVHILSAELVWLSRWRGQSPQAHRNPAQFPNVEALQASWRELENELQVFLASLDDDKLRAPISYSTLAGQPQAQPLWQQMVHLANHSSYHRGQITTMLRQIGAVPVATDLIAFFREAAARS